MKNCIITGGTRGIGLSISKYLLQSGYNVYSLTKTGNDPLNCQYFHSYKCDITDRNKTHQIINQILVNNKVNLLIYNGGITKDSFFHKMQYDDWFNVINTNLVSCYNVIQKPLIQMRNANEGNIILISSINGSNGQIGQTNYSASKSGLHGFSKSLALENAVKNIRVNVISPGYINTNMTDKIDKSIADNIKKNIPMKTFGDRDDIVLAVDFLIKNKYITGSNIHVNGGLFMN